MRIVISIRTRLTVSSLGDLGTCGGGKFGKGCTLCDRLFSRKRALMLHNRDFDKCVPPVCVATATEVSAHFLLN